MNQLVADSNRNIVILINDYWSEYGTALDKFSERLGRPVKGILLVDKHLYDTNSYNPDDSGKYETVVCDFSHIRSLSDTLNKFSDNLLAVVSSSERNQPYLKKVLPHVPYINLPSESSLDWSTHKATMRQLLGSYNPDLVPRFMQITDSNPEHIKRAEEHLTFPVIVKPNGLATSILVKRADTQSQLEETLKQSFAVINEMYTRDRGRGTPSIVIEEFIDGNIYSVDCYVNEDGFVWSPPFIKVTTAYSIGKDGFYSYSADTALDLKEDEIRAGQEAAVQAVHALGLRSTVAHIELFHTGNGWKIIELGARPGGYRHDMYMLGYGMDHTYNELLVKVGLPPEIPEKNIAYSSAINIYADDEGRIESITGFDEAAANSSIYWLKLYKKQGDKALFCSNGGQYVVRGVLHNKDLIQLNKDIEFVRNTIKINIKAV